METEGQNWLDQMAFRVHEKLESASSFVIGNTMHAVGLAQIAKRAHLKTTTGGLNNLFRRIADQIDSEDQGYEVIGTALSDTE